MDIAKNNGRYKILTDTGWSDFKGVINKGKKSTLLIELENSNVIEVTPDHEIFLETMCKVEAKNLKVGDNVITETGTSKIKEISKSVVQDVYDIYNAEKNYRFYANGMLVSNCKFITFEETLIDAVTLQKLKGIDPINVTGTIKWFSEISTEMTYLVSLDPSMGTGGDNAAIQVLELPTMRQVAEWQHNKTRIEDQVLLVKEITKTLDQKGAFEIYWSVENNSLGEAALVAIRDIGEEMFSGTMLHDPQGKRGSRRKGFNTTARSKQEACATLKRIVEKDVLKVYSRNLISELRTFISTGGSYAAKSGNKDDLVMALILAIRMSDFVSTWDDRTQAALKSVTAEDEDDYDEPMPLMIM